MAVFNIFGSMFGGRHVADAATEVFARARDEVWVRVERQVTGMSQAEAMGYTRAHAKLLVDRLTAEVVASHPKLGTWAHSEVSEDAMRQLIGSIWRVALESKKVKFERRAAA